MKLFLFLACALLATFSSEVHAGYETYVQANKTDAGNKVEVLVLVEDLASPKAKRDAALCYLILSPGKAKTTVVGNKYFPGRIYTFTISFKRPIITIRVSITENGHELFHSNQRFASWKGF